MHGSQADNDQSKERDLEFFAFGYTPLDMLNTLDPDLLTILRCPITRSSLRQDGDYLVAEEGGLRYPVRDGIPVMLVEEAVLPPGVESIEAFKARYRK